MTKLEKSKNRMLLRLIITTTPKNTKRVFLEGIEDKNKKNVVKFKFGKRKIVANVMKTFRTLKLRRRADIGSGQLLLGA